MSPKSITLIVMVMAILVNGDYPGHVAFTEAFNYWIFGPLIGFTPYELVSLFMFFTAITKARNGSEPIYRSELYKVAMRVALAPLAALMLSAAYGLIFHNGNLKIAAWQVRGVIPLLAWTIVSFDFCRSMDDVFRLLDAAAAAVTLKTLHSLGVFFFAHGGSVTVEWLTSHEFSLYMGITLVYMGVRVVAWPGAAQKLLLLLPIAMIGFHWVVNERRVSYLGVMFSCVFGVAFLYKIVRLWHVLVVVLIILLGILQQVATWSSPDNWLRGIVEPGVDSSSDYRDIENFDLYWQVSQHPFVGVGFGNPFATPYPLPDIVVIASLLAWVPHNALLMVWSMAGPVGLASIGLFVAFGVAAFVRLFHSSPSLKSRTIAFVGFSALVQWTLYLWADMGLGLPAVSLMPALLSGCCLKLLHQRRAA